MFNEIGRQYISNGHEKVFPLAAHSAAILQGEKCLENLQQLCK